MNANRKLAKCRGTILTVNGLCFMNLPFPRLFRFSVNFQFMPRAAASAGMKYSASYLTEHPYVRSISNDRS